MQNDKYSFPTALSYIDFVADYVYERCKLILQFNDILPSESQYLIAMIINNAVLLQKFSFYKQNDLRFLASWYITMSNDIANLDSIVWKDTYSKHNRQNFVAYNKSHQQLHKEYEIVSMESKHVTEEELRRKSQ